MKRAAFVAIFLAVLGVVGSLAWGPGEEFDRRYGPFWGSIRDALTVMDDVEQEVSRKTIAQLIERRQEIARLTDKELEGQFFRIENVIQDQKFEGLFLSALTNSELDRLRDALPPAIRDRFLKIGSLSREPLVALFKILHADTMRAARGMLSALDVVLKLPVNAITKEALDAIGDARAKFTTECGRNRTIIGLLESIVNRQK